VKLNHPELPPLPETLPTDIENHDDLLKAIHHVILDVSEMQFIILFSNDDNNCWIPRLKYWKVNWFAITAGVVILSATAFQI